MDTLTHSSLETMLASGAFFWAAGVEDTFITDPWPATGRTLDEYELTQHCQQRDQDLELFAQLGVKIVRYGIPWHIINPERGSWDWTFADGAIDKLESLGIQPIVDLVHYGLPRWIEGAYTNPDFPRFMAEYAARTAERYRGRVHCYTPLNEPRVTAWYCGKLGWWPPGLRGWRGFLRVMASVCQGIVQTMNALKSVDPDILIVHVDATDLYESHDPMLEAEVRKRQEIVFLALDLISGRVSETHPLRPWLVKNGIDFRMLDEFQTNRVDLRFIGINLYPLFSRKVLSKGANGLRMRMPYASAEIVDRLSTLYYERYRVPIMISETASEGSVKRRSRWLEDSVEAVERVRSRGIPLAGYTWWPLFALVTWAYRQGDKEPAYYLKQMGLWDLVKSEEGVLKRVPTPLIEQFQKAMQLLNNPSRELKTAA